MSIPSLGIWKVQEQGISKSGIQQGIMFHRGDFSDGGNSKQVFLGL